MTTSGPATPALRRSDDRVLGGVCAGIAERLGVDPVLVRIGAVALGVLSAGSAVLLYLIAWVLVPPTATRAAVSDPDRPGPEPDPAGRPGTAGLTGPPEAAGATMGGAQPGGAAPAGDPAAAWQSVGAELKGLAAGLRAGPRIDTTGRRPLDAADAAATAVGERLRSPEVRAAAERVATGVADAVSASVAAARRRSGRGPV